MRTSGVAILRKRVVLVTVAVLALGTGCRDSEARAPELDPDTPWWVAEGRPAPERVDSILPVDTALERFREGTAPTGSLAGGAESVEALIEAFVAALEAGDAEGLAALALDRSEFAWLYYPHTIYTTAPYELSPELVWFQQQNVSSRGLGRLLARYGERDLGITGVHCPEPAMAFGPGTLRDGCLVQGLSPDGEIAEERLFGSLLEIEGRVKFVSFANEL